MKFKKWIAKKISNLLQYSNEYPPFLIITSKNVKTGNYSYHNGNMVIRGNGELEIGSHCAFGQDIKFILSNHTYEYPSLQYSLYLRCFGEFPYIKKSGKTIVGSDVWIGDNVIILPNVTIGNGSIVGTGSIVTKNVPDFAIVGGNPAKLLKYRFNENQIKGLNENKWWDWSDEEIIKNRDFFFETPSK